MKLTIIGGSAGAPGPGDACAGYLLSNKDTCVLLDCGSGVLSKLRMHMNVRDLDAIVISHLHADHTLDLIAMRYLLMYAPIANAIVPIPLYLPPGGLAFLKRVASAFQMGSEADGVYWSNVLSPQEYDPSASLFVGSMAFRFAEMVHYIPSWAFRIEDKTDGAVITYSGDCGPRSPIAEFCAGSDLLLCDSTYLEYPRGESIDSQGHLTASDAGRVATIAGVRMLVLTHTWHEFSPDVYLSSCRTTFIGLVDIARSGLWMEVTNHDKVRHPPNPIDSQLPTND